MPAFTVENLGEIEATLQKQPFLSGDAYPNHDDVNVFAALKSTPLLKQPSPTRRPRPPSTTGSTSSGSSRRP